MCSRSQESDCLFVARETIGSQLGRRGCHGEALRHILMHHVMGTFLIETRSRAGGVTSHIRDSNTKGSLSYIKMLVIEKKKTLCMDKTEVPITVRFHSIDKGHRDGPLNPEKAPEMRSFANGRIMCCGTRKLMMLPGQ